MRLELEHHRPVRHRAQSTPCGAETLSHALTRSEGCRANCPGRNIPGADVASRGADKECVHGWLHAVRGEDDMHGGGAGQRLSRACVREGGREREGGMGACRSKHVVCRRIRPADRFLPFDTHSCTTRRKCVSVRYRHAALRRRFAPCVLAASAIRKGCGAPPLSLLFVC
jgi:hypothetical protein